MWDCAYRLFLVPCLATAAHSVGALHKGTRALFTNFLALIGVTQCAEKGRVFLLFAAAAPCVIPFPLGPSFHLTVPCSRLRAPDVLTREPCGCGWVLVGSAALAVQPQQQEPSTEQGGRAESAVGGTDCL